MGTGWRWRQRRWGSYLDIFLSDHAMRYPDQKFSSRRENYPLWKEGRCQSSDSQSAKYSMFGSVKEILWDCNDILICGTICTVLCNCLTWTAPIEALSIDPKAIPEELLFCEITNVIEEALSPKRRRLSTKCLHKLYYLRIKLEEVQAFLPQDWMATFRDEGGPVLKTMLLRYWHPSRSSRSA